MAIIKVKNPAIDLDAAEIPNLDTSKITSGTLADARFPATLPAASAANLTNIPAANITGTLPAISGANLTGLTSSLSSLTDTTVSSSDPTTTSNKTPVGHLWINSTSGESYVLTDATTNQNDWQNIGEGTGSVKYFPGLTSLVMIGGGGGGASDMAGSGGAGGLLHFTGYRGTIQYGTQYTITIGNGGAAQSGQSGDGNNGSNTTAFGETAGGGFGGSSDGGAGGGGNSGGGDSGSASTSTSASLYTSFNGYSNDGGANLGNPGAGGAGLDVDEVFSTDLYTGNSSSQTITNGIDLSGEGGLIWTKNRDSGQNNVL